MAVSAKCTVTSDVVVGMIPSCRALVGSDVCCFFLRLDGMGTKYPLSHGNIMNISSLRKDRMNDHCFSYFTSWLPAYNP